MNTVSKYRYENTISKYVQAQGTAHDNKQLHKSKQHSFFLQDTLLLAARRLH